MYLLKLTIYKSTVYKKVYTAQLATVGLEAFIAIMHFNDIAF